MPFKLYRTSIFPQGAKSDHLKTKAKCLFNALKSIKATVWCVGEQLQLLMVWIASLIIRQILALITVNVQGCEALMEVRGQAINPTTYSRTMLQFIHDPTLAI